MATCLWLAAKSHAWPRLHRGATWPHTCAHTPVGTSTEAWVYSSLTFHIKVASIVILPCLSVCLCTKRKYFLDLFFLNDGYVGITHYQVLFQSGRDNEMYPHGNLILLWDCIEKKKGIQSVSSYTASTKLSVIQALSQLGYHVLPSSACSLFPCLSVPTLSFSHSTVSSSSPSPRHISSLHCLYPIHSSSILTCIHRASVFNWQHWTHADHSSCGCYVTSANLFGAHLLLFLAHGLLLHPKFQRHNQRKNCHWNVWPKPIVKRCFNYFYDTEAGCITESKSFIWLLQKRSKKKYKSPQNTPIQKEHQLGKLEKGRAIYMLQLGPVIFGQRQLFSFFGSYVHYHNQFWIK